MTQEWRRSPLAHRNPIASANGGISLQEQPFVGLLVLRGTLEAVGGAVKSVLDLALPDTPGTFSVAADMSALWIGPDEWVLVTTPGAEAETMSALKSALSGVHSQVVDVSDYYTTLNITGADARDVLAKITMVDMHPRAFKTGHAISSIFGHGGAWLQMTGDEDTGGVSFNLYVRRSMADYLWCLLADGGREFGLPKQGPIGKVKLHLPHFENA